MMTTIVAPPRYNFRQRRTNTKPIPKTREPKKNAKKQTKTNTVVEHLHK